MPELQVSALCFFFSSRRRHTRWTGDWSSDVCSSDLQVIVSLGFNGNALALVGTGARQGNCIDAFGNSLINQTPQCNAANFYRMANAEIARGTLTIPAAGTGNDGQACQTTRDFALID